jgi:hypothetical protein
MRLAGLARGGWLTQVSEDAYDSGVVGLTRVGPLGGVPGASKLVRVYVRDLVTHDGGAVLTLRWEATGPGGGLFPALDADITLSPVSEQESRLTLDGAYRPPLASLGAGLDRVILHRVAAPTMRTLLEQIADGIMAPGVPEPNAEVAD